MSWTEKTRIYIFTEKNLYNTKAHLHARPDCTYLFSISYWQLSLCHTKTV